MGYRALLSIVLLLGLINDDTRQVVGVLNPELYFNVAISYLIINMLLLTLSRSAFASNQAFLFVVFFVDILAIVMLSDASGGMASGLPILLMITVAASAIIIGNGSIATLIAALSVIALLADTLRLINEQVLELNSLFPAGLLGMLIFTVSLLIQAVARRVGKAEALARKRAADLYNLQRLNEQIVQHMQTGILLVYADDRVRLMNQAASRLLAPEQPQPMQQGRDLQTYNSEVYEQFHQWRNTKQHQPRPISIGEDDNKIVAHFRTLKGEDSSQTLVFIEDYTPVTQYAQSLKLASLGRLTASIAHEIRNPLGAVSHAAQLLGESDELNEPDQRLSEIIQQHTQRMNSIIESVMQISRRQPPQPKELKLNRWIKNFVEEYKATINFEADIQIEPSTEEINVRFDADNLQRVMNNLLDNALRHSELKTGKATAAIAVSIETPTSKAHIDVIDQGEGIAASEQAKLFEPFYTTVVKGTGLGLYLCKELCEINQASLTYRRTGTGASCFRVLMTRHS
ncbi:PAS domain-containing protein [Halieaceae bacterium IMCC14734]|uniref:histidine kinase n=1 Tax=Candidatus Litorirhabdus singularis TaxID=2518993 RepID=A0ABT3TLM4_9GAMM|nr:PAS domain-containing protein [Candidatus Litorirhabdus singularis]